MRLSHAIPGFEAGSRPHSRNLPQTDSTVKELWWAPRDLNSHP